ncbi:MAG: agmatinase [Candidatus Diapherotrites archaeon]
MKGKGTPNFGGLPKEFSGYEKAEIVVLPVPYDGTSTWIKGADKGPKAILEASANMELYDIDTDSQVCERGIFTDKPICAGTKMKPEKMVGEVEKKVAGHLGKGKFVVTLGGEHSVSVGAIKAHAEKYRGMCVLQLDAHTDLRQEYEGSKYSHACAMARAREICPIVQAGIRSMAEEEKEFLANGKGGGKGNVFFAKDIAGKGGWQEKVVALLAEKVYITIDLDVFDPSIMPSTGTPEPGGLGWYEVMELLQKATAEREVVGFDVVELCPTQHNRAPNFTAAKLVYQILSQKFRGGK